MATKQKRKSECARCEKPMSDVGVLQESAPYVGMRLCAECDAALQSASAPEDA